MVSQDFYNFKDYEYKDIKMMKTKIQTTKYGKEITIN